MSRQFSPALWCVKGLATLYCTVLCFIINIKTGRDFCGGASYCVENGEEEISQTLFGLALLF